jgi:hypothetical protein
VIGKLQKLLWKVGYQLVRLEDLHMDEGYLDRLEFQYVLWLDRIYSKISSIPGNIVEIGVARGRNSIIFGRLMQLHGETAIRNYYGFDTFEGYVSQDLAKDTHLTADSFTGISYDDVRQRIAKAGLGRACHLIKGDIRQTAPRFAENAGPNFQPGHLKVALLYIDCNAYDPALFSMRYFSRFMADGGIICIDEKMQGSETRALDDFSAECRRPVTRDPGPFGLPAYIAVRRG